MVPMVSLTMAPVVAMVGRVGVEPTTSRLSGVRSNHLSYRPPPCHRRPRGRGRREPAQAAIRDFAIRREDPHRSPVMKGHEDDGMFFGTTEALPGASPGAFGHILRKEVIQPQV